jgi:hypothetical protein
MKKFTEATVSAMGQQSPGFAAANNMVRAPTMSFGPPPAPIETKAQAPPPRPSMQFTEGPGNRQDINAARGTMFREQGIDMNSGFADLNAPSRSQSSQPTMRQEMKGPRTDIDSIISGLKTKTVNIHESPAPVQSAPMSSSNSNSNFATEDDSMISISSLKDMQNASMPKRTNRRQNRSNKNTISLDI